MKTICNYNNISTEKTCDDKKQKILKFNTMTN